MQTETVQPVELNDAEIDAVAGGGVHDSGNTGVAG
jgi:hypothetical protein